MNQTPKQSRCYIQGQRIISVADPSIGVQGSEVPGGCSLRSGLNWIWLVPKPELLLPVWDRLTSGPEQQIHAHDCHP